MSGQVRPSDAEKPKDSCFSRKPLSDHGLIVELQDMIGAGALAIFPTSAMTVSDATGSRTIEGLVAEQDTLTAENDGLRLLLEQAELDAETLLAQAGIDAKEREAAEKLQKLIVEEMHHRIKNTLATVSAIASQSLANGDLVGSRPASNRGSADCPRPGTRSADAGQLVQR